MRMLRRGASLLAVLFLFTLGGAASVSADGTGTATAPNLSATGAGTSTTGDAVPGTTTATGEKPQAPGAPAVSAANLAGQSLYDEHCASCHGFDLRGRHDYAPSLRGVGAGPVEFYTSSGRMPLADIHAEPMRGPSIFTHRQVVELGDYVRAVGGGPAAPTADPSQGSLALGFTLFDENCAGCHSIVARGGIAVNALVPNLQQASPDQIAEAVRSGPYVMPHFSAIQLNQHDLDSIARYVIWTRKPDNAGGWGIYNIGPIPEGIVAWFVGLLGLVIIARLIGERIERT